MFIYRYVFKIKTAETRKSLHHQENRRAVEWHKKSDILHIKVENWVNYTLTDWLYYLNTM